MLWLLLHYSAYNSHDSHRSGILYHALVPVVDIVDMVALTKEAYLRYEP